MGHVFNISTYKQGSVRCAARHVPGVGTAFHQSSLKLSRLPFEVGPLGQGPLQCGILSRCMVGIYQMSGRNGFQWHTPGLCSAPHGGVSGAKELNSVAQLQLSKQSSQSKGPTLQAPCSTNHLLY